MNRGLKFEADFIKELNNHNYSELNLNLQKFMRFLFNDVNTNDKIYCGKIGGHQKADIFIKIKDNIKYISLKSGSQNSVHVEKVKDFSDFLLKIGIERSIIDNLLKYHYGDDTLIGNGKRRYSAQEAKIRYKQQILHFNKIINHSKLLPKIIERILFIGTNELNKCVNAFYYGDIDIGTWCSQYELLTYCIENKCMYMNTPHFSFLTYQNWCRNITFLKKSEPHREYIQVKWFSILSDITKIRQLFDSVTKNN